MKLLITGAGGFLGSALVERLLAHGQRDLRCLLRDRSKTARLESVRASYPDANIEIIYGNLVSPQDAARAAQGVEVIFHLAAAMKGAPADMFLNSVVTARNLLDAAVAGRVRRIVLVSSFGVYGVSRLRRGSVINEDTLLETSPERRDVYSFAKLWQEQLFHEYRERHAFELVVLRPGVIYGERGGHFSTRVGLNLFGVFLHLGGRNLLPLSYVENCAEAIVATGFRPGEPLQVYNVHDDDLPTCAQYLRRYCREVRPLRSVRVPYAALKLLSSVVEKYNRHSRGQLPAVFTPYKTAAQWAGNRFDNSRLKAAGWKQLVSTEEGIRRAFAAFREHRPAGH